MAISTVVKTKRDGTLTIADNAGAHSLTVAFEAGDFKLNIPGRTVNLFLDRGAIGSPPAIRYGDDQPMTGSFTAQLRDLSDASYITLEEILTNSGYFASTWVSTMGSTGEVKTVKCTWTIEGTDHGDSADHTIALAYCYVTGSLGDGDPSSIEVSFTDFELYPTVT